MSIVTKICNQPRPETQQLLASINALDQNTLVVLGIVYIAIYDVGLFLSVVRKRWNGEILCCYKNNAVSLSLIIRNGNNGNAYQIYETSCTLDTLAPTITKMTNRRHFRQLTK